MAWTRIPGLPGKLYVPDAGPSKKKHACRTCYACQWCDETRCEVCRANAGQESPPIKDDPAQR
ncbi:conserved hypothetical protein [Desulfosarcina cetonica]|nr:conserved hypothetical protein [Desulfosarcina cetonica]